MAFSDLKRDYAVSPGEILAEIIEARGIGVDALAALCARPISLLEDIVAGKAPVDSETADALARVLGIDAVTWIKLESAYRTAVG